MSGDVHVRFCERLGVKFPRATHLVLFGPDRATLHAWRTALAERLAALRLVMHRGAHPRPVGEGIPFLGFTVLPERRRLKRRKAVGARRRLARLASACREGRVQRSAFAASVRGWLNHARYGNTIGLRKAVLRDVRI